mmetsp:Transcript_9551/g.27327  ORF Transcript_9551/g.27327 Transcript_9551/m.27327 type:complete len:216 (+) Transcript_9551:5744-6391(+)
MTSSSWGPPKQARTTNRPDTELWLPAEYCATGSCCDLCLPLPPPLALPSRCAPMSHMARQTRLGLVVVHNKWWPSALRQHAMMASSGRPTTLSAWVSTLMIRMRCSLAQIRWEPSRDTSMCSTFLSWKLSRLLPLVSHRTRVLSRDPVTMRRPSGSHAAVLTGAVCFTHSITQTPVSGFHSLRVLSWEAVASRASSGDQARKATQSLWPLRVRRC